MPEIWDFAAQEISENGNQTLELLEADNCTEHYIWDLTKWTCQSILEFQDLQDMPFPYKGKYLNINYLFFEGITALREAMLCGINGQVHASLAALRSAFEIITTHYWWKEKLRFANDYGEFYDWLRGDSEPFPFSRVIRDSFTDMERPPEFITEEEFRLVYRKLCSYAHKPTKSEAITAIRGSNVAAPTPATIAYWLSLVYAGVRSILSVAVVRDPICLFPVSLYRKFGFNPPVGVFFDEYNFFPLSRALGVEQVEQLRSYYETREFPKSTLDWFHEWPDLNDQEILDSWDDDEHPIKYDGDTFEAKAAHRLALMKINMRAIHYTFSYGDEGPEIPDIQKMIDALHGDV